MLKDETSLLENTQKGQQRLNTPRKLYTSPRVLIRHIPQTASGANGIGETDNQDAAMY